MTTEIRVITIYVQERPWTYYVDAAPEVTDVDIRTSLQRIHDNRERHQHVVAS